MLRYSLVSAVNPRRLTKEFSLAPDGQLQAAPAGNLTLGHVQHAAASDLRQLAQQLDALPSSAAPAWGLSTPSDAPIVTLDQLAQRPDAIARSSKHFAFGNGPGVLMLDHDAPPPGMPGGLSSDVFVGLLYAACPALANAPLMIRQSASAGLAKDDGTVLSPLTRWRAYIAVSNAADIPEAGKRLMTRLWAVSGMGWFEVSKAGTALQRSILDGSVWQPERLDFAAAPVLAHAGLRRSTVPPLFFGPTCGLFDLAAIQVDGPTACAAVDNIAKARQAVAGEMLRVRHQWVDAQAPSLSRRRGISDEQARAVLSRASEAEELAGDFLVTLADGSEVSVDHMLQHPGEFEGVHMRDPLEPDYRNDPRIAVARLTRSPPMIYSYAHGERRYRLHRNAASIEWVAAAPTATLTTTAAAAAVGPKEPRYYVLAADPFNTARALIQRHYTHADGPCLKAWQDSFYQWDGARWAEMTTADVRARLYDFLDREGESHYRPSQAKVSNLVDSLKAAAHLPSTFTAPCWITGTEVAAAAELVPCANGLLHLPSRSMLPATPRFFNLNAVPFDYLPDAPPPVEWLRFLGQVWPHDPEAVATLQELFGYLLTPDTSQQKIFLIVGPKRSGKGTIARVLTEMLGAANVTGPTLSSMAAQFGLQGLVGKLTAIVSDARLGGRADPKQVAENLLRISGEDRVEVERKHMTSITMRLSVRFLLLTNELPRIADASGAMASRFVILKMSESFFGREDPGLTQRLLSELPGVLQWSVDGWHRLKARGHFIEPRSSAGAAQELADLGSPIAAFVRDVCEMAPHHQVPRDDLFTEWRNWCAQQGVKDVGTKDTFGADLKAALPEITDSRPRVGGNRVRCYVGIGIGPAVHPGPPFKALQITMSNPFSNSGSAPSVN